jgi:hypothetical protein
MSRTDEIKYRLDIIFQIKRVDDGYYRIQVALEFFSVCCIINEVQLNIKLHRVKRFLKS